MPESRVLDRADLISMVEPPHKLLYLSNTDKSRLFAKR